MIKFIQYGVRAVDEKSVFNEFCFGFINWFNGENVVCIESENFSEETKAWKWIESELKNIKED